MLVSVTLTLSAQEGEGEALELERVAVCCLTGLLVVILG